MSYVIPHLPIQKDFYTKEIMKKIVSANKALAELNGVAEKIPNQNILINSLSLQEAKDSSEIENIITTHDELYKSQVDQDFNSSQTKEVENYREALLYGFNLVKENKLLLERDILKIQEILEKNTAGFRTQGGTKLENQNTKEVVYTPPQTYEQIAKLMKNLEKYINDTTLDDNDPLVKMAIIHHQFESIHPFYDGNGRTGRIINILYLKQNDLLDMPILYLSNFIIKNKGTYYELLQSVRENKNWENWVVFMLEAIEQTSLGTIEMVNAIYDLMGELKKYMKENISFYSKDLLEILFSHPYTKIDFLVQGLGITRKTGAKYLNELVERGIMELIQIKNSKYYINTKLYKLLQKGL